MSECEQSTEEQSQQSIQLINLQETLRTKLHNYGMQCFSSDCGEVDYYDDYTTRFIGHNELLTNNIYETIDEVLERIHQCPVSYSSNMHAVEYTFSGTYHIKKHVDSCSRTIIVYLQKDSTVNDNFFITTTDPDGSQNVVKFGEDLWEAGMLVFNGNLPHSGVFHGDGKRYILAIFDDLEQRSDL